MRLGMSRGVVLDLIGLCFFREVCRVLGVLYCLRYHVQDGSAMLRLPKSSMRSGNCQMNIELKIA